MFQNGQTELTNPILGFVRLPEGVYVYAKRRSLFAAKGLYTQKNQLKWDFSTYLGLFEIFELSTFHIIIPFLRSGLFYIPFL